jgi:hypothetical protein
MGVSGCVSVGVFSGYVKVCVKFPNFQKYQNHKNVTNEKMEDNMKFMEDDLKIEEDNLEMVKTHKSKLGTSVQILYLFL